MDAGTPEKYLQLHRDLLNGKSTQYKPAAGHSTGDNTKIDPSAEISGPVVIGPDCQIGPRVKITGPAVIGAGCEIGADCRIEDSVLWKNVRLETGVQLKSSVLANDCLMKEGSSGEGVVLAERVTVEKGVKPKPGSRIQPGETVGPIT